MISERRNGCATPYRRGKTHLDLRGLPCAPEASFDKIGGEVAQKNPQKNQE